MKLQKYCLLPAGLMIALVALSGCPGKGDHAKHEIVVYDWTKADVLAQDETIQNIVMSGDGQHTYVVSEAPVVGGGSGATFSGLYHSSDVKNWHEIKYGEATKALNPIVGAPAIAGKAVMVGLDKITSQAVTREGLIISANDSTGGPAFGAVYFRGRNAVAAWANDGSGSHFDAATVTAGKRLAFGVASKNGQEMIAMFGYDDKAKSFGGVGSLAPAKVAAKLEPNAGAGFTKYTPDSSTFAVVNKDLWFFEGLNGLVRVKIENLAVAGVVRAEPSPVSTALGGSDTFDINGGDKNLATSQLLSANDKLYVSFRTSKDGTTNDIDGTGGIVICTFKPDGDLQACSNNKSWNKVAVTSMAKDADGAVWAVSSEGLVKVEDDGSKGAVFGSTHLPLPTDHHAEVYDDQVYQRGALAGTGITVKAAAFTKEGHLLLGVEQIAGRKNDLYVIKRETKTITHDHHHHH
jgi:hypothetical protein